MQGLGCQGLGCQGLGCQGLGWQGLGCQSLGCQGWDGVGLGWQGSDGRGWDIRSRDAGVGMSGAGMPGADVEGAGMAGFFECHSLISLPFSDTLLLHFSVIFLSDARGEIYSAHFSDDITESYVDILHKLERLLSIGTGHQIDKKSFTRHGRSIKDDQVNIMLAYAESKL